MSQYLQFMLVLHIFFGFIAQYFVFIYCFLPLALYCNLSLLLSHGFNIFPFDLIMGCLLYYELGKININCSLE